MLWGIVVAPIVSGLILAASTRNLNKKKEEKENDRTRNPLYYLQILATLPLILPSSLTPSLFLVNSVYTFLHSSKPHLRATKAQIPAPSRRDILARVGTILSFISFPCTPAYSVGDKGGAAHYPCALPSLCAFSNISRIPMVLARCRILRIYRKYTRLRL